MKKYFFYNIKFVLVVVLFLCVSVEFVYADAWWGEGYRPKDWVLKNGGTIINYTVTGTSHTDKYKAIMFQNGKYVEVEFGKNASFDDAKNGTYTINFYKCNKSCEDHKFDKKEKVRDKDEKVASINIVARSGQINNLVFNASSNTVGVVGRSGGYVRANPFVAQRAQAKKDDRKACVYKYAKKQSLYFEQFLFLTQKTNQDQFRDVNIEVGIIPQFLVKNKL